MYDKLLPGRYIKFSLFALKFMNSAMLRLTLVNVNQDGIEENVIYECGLTYGEVREIMYDNDAPKALVKFIKSAFTYVEESDLCEDTLSIEQIRQYLEKYIGDDQ
jgi:NDP-sugar pyrophosphorylase family protein